MLYITAITTDSDDEDNLEDVPYIIETPEEYKALLKIIHTNEVSDTLENRENNRVLDQPAPKIHKSEVKLPRETRRILAQLRSNFSPFLQSYMQRINNNIEENVSDLCPKCAEEPHTTSHLFRCRENPTDLEPIALWEDPIQAAAFLELLLEETVNYENDDWITLFLQEGNQQQQQQHGVAI